MVVRILAAVLAIVLIQPLPAADPLTIGDPAPKLFLKEFVKGEPIKELKKGTAYVIEFSGTQCAPCVKAMPILSDLQKKYPMVPFISIYGEDIEVVKNYVAKNSDKMGFSVAADDNSSMAKTWMTEAIMGGIPCVFVVNSEQRIAWVGHPFDLEKPLKNILDGTHDYELGKLRFRMVQATKTIENTDYNRLHEHNEIVNRAIKFIHQAEFAQAVKLLDDAIERIPEWQFEFSRIKLMALSQDPKTSEQAIQFSIALFGKLNATRFDKTDIPGRCDHLSDCAYTLLQAYSKNPNRFFLALAERFIESGTERLQYIHPRDETDQFKKHTVAYFLMKNRVELHSLRQEWTQAVNRQNQLIELIKANKYGREYLSLSEKDWTTRQEKRLVEAKEKLATLESKAREKLKKK